jgi:hypothetical protein
MSEQLACTYVVIVFLLELITLMLRNRSSAVQDAADNEEL